MTTLAVIIVLLAFTAAWIWLIEKARQVYRKSNRANVRRLQRYLDMLPPAHPNDRTPW